jgi:hypothetical protein
MRFLRRIIRDSTILIVVAFGMLIVQRYSSGFEFLHPWLFHSKMGGSGHEHKWWKEAVVYQIYIPSFKVSNDDGLGDIPGIISKLDYLSNLGVDVVAIGTHYQSPQMDRPTISPTMSESISLTEQWKMY